MDQDEPGSMIDGRGWAKDRPGWSPLETNNNNVRSLKEKLLALF